MHTDATAFKNIKANSISVTNYLQKKKCGNFSKNTERNQYSKYTINFELESMYFSINKQINVDLKH